MQMQQTVSDLEIFKEERILSINTNNQGENKSINKYQCGNDLDILPLFNNAGKYAKFNVLMYNRNS